MSIGLIGLGAIGGNLAKNIQKSNEIHVYDRVPGIVTSLTDKYTNIHGYDTMQSMISNMDQPRTIITSLHPGEITESVVKALSKELSENDTVIDCSNEHYRISRNRGAYCQCKGINYLGTGLSGGAEGALKGPALMIGGSETAFRKNEKLLKSFSKNVTYMGQDYGVGHYTKMVHNGIEYGMLQGIADVYAYCNQDEHYMMEILRATKNTDIDGYLTQSAIKVLTNYNVHKIADVGKMNNTGLWCSQVGLEYGIPTPIINSAVNSRITSSYVKALHTQQYSNYAIDTIVGVDALRFVFASAILEGYDLMTTRHVNDESIKRAWSSGTIIDCPMIGEKCRDVVNQTIENARILVMYCTSAGIPCPAISAALTHYDFTHQTSTSMKFIMAQRNYFGQHEIIEA